MGLDVSHDAWSGAYGAFTRWRHALAKAAGYEVARVVEDEGVPGRYAPQTILIDWGHVAEKNYYGDWDAMPCSTTGPDPLLLLVAHSDCEGYIYHAHLMPLADRLKELLPLVEGQDGGGHLGDVRATTERFIAGCQAAHDAGESLEFG